MLWVLEKKEFPSDLLLLTAARARETAAAWPLVEGPGWERERGMGLKARHRSWAEQLGSARACYPFSGIEEAAMLSLTHHALEQIECWFIRILAAVLNKNRRPWNERISFIRTSKCSVCSKQTFELHITLWMNAGGKTQLLVNTDTVLLWDFPPPLKWKGGTMCRFMHKLLRGKGVLRFLMLLPFHFIDLVLRNLLKDCWLKLGFQGAQRPPR